MNKIITLTLFGIVMVGCASMLQHKPYLPTGSIPCNKDPDCPKSYVCGFGGVDQYASCQYKAAEYSFRP